MAKDMDWFLGRNTAPTSPADLALAAAGDVAARNRVIEANMPLVLHIAKRHVRPGVDLHDLCQWGAMGLMRAAEKFEPGREKQFSTYAYNWVKQKIQRCLAERHMIRIPTATLQAYQRQNRQAARAGQMTRAGKAIKRVLTAHVGGLYGENGKLLPLAAPTAESTEECPEATALRLAVASLPARERRIIEGRWLGGELRMLDLGHELGLSRERIRQIEYATLQRLRMILTRGLPAETPNTQTPEPEEPKPAPVAVAPAPRPARNHGQWLDEKRIRDAMRDRCGVYGFALIGEVSRELGITAAELCRRIKVYGIAVKK